MTSGQGEPQCLVQGVQTDQVGAGLRPHLVGTPGAEEAPTKGMRALRVRVRHGDSASFRVVGRRCGNFVKLRLVRGPTSRAHIRSPGQKATMAGRLARWVLGRNTPHARAVDCAHGRFVRVLATFASRNVKSAESPRMQREGKTGRPGWGVGWW